MKKAIVIGSGAGGCAAARELARDFKVTILEAGKPFEPFKYKLSRFEPMRRAGLFIDERMIQALFPAMRVVVAKQGLVHVDGRCVGGTTTLATGNALRYDRYLREIGIDLDEEFAELDNEVPITRGHYKTWSNLTVRLFAAFEELGFDPQVTPKFMNDPEKCTSCGHCVLGCRFGAKWSAERLLDGLPHIEVRTGCTAEQILIEQGRAKGVIVRGKKRKREELYADLVIVAAGGLNTPVILEASGFATKPNLFVDPVICVAAPWPEAHLDAQLPMPFVSQRDEYILSPYFDWLSFFFDGNWRKPSKNIMSIMVKYADSSIGSFDGKHLSKPMTDHDEAIVKRSTEEASRVLDVMGVARDDMFLGILNAGHPGGCLPLTEDEAETLHHAELPANLYVADASLFPRSIGNPPILTIMALAKKVARRAAEAVA